MAFDLDKVRLERFRAEMGYHAAYNYLTLKGVLAERWAHGPVFGAVADQGNQITLTPASGFQDKRIDGVYGLRASSFDHECIDCAAETYEQAGEWFNDVVEVLKPKRITRLHTQRFALYPLSNIDAAEAATRRLKVRYYKDELANLQPDGYRNFSAVSGISIRDDRYLSIEMGVVGPPHKNNFFGVPDDERDSKWWMGLKINLNRTADDGIEGNAAEALKSLIAEGADEYDRLVHQALGSIF